MRVQTVVISTESAFEFTIMFSVEPKTRDGTLLTKCNTFKIVFKFEFKI